MTKQGHAHVDIEHSNSDAVKDEVSTCDSGIAPRTSDKSNMCNECGGELTPDVQYWYKCLECKTYDMCAYCFEETDAHNEHASHVCIQHSSSKTEDGRCGICSLWYDNRDYHVIHCKKCKIHYMCSRCLRQGMHVYHNQHLERMSLSDYNSTIK